MELEATGDAQLLSQLEFFSAMDRDALEAIAARATEAQFLPRQPIVRQGEMGNGLFVIVEGSAQVTRDGNLVARLGPGDLVGELSVLERAPRAANVVAMEPTRCLAVAAWDLEALIHADPKIAIALLRALARRVRKTSEPHEH